jgi:hypothetical protein
MNNQTRANTDTQRREAIAPACCDSTLQSSCCEPEAKPTCCGEAATRGGQCRCQTATRGER